MGDMKICHVCEIEKSEEEFHTITGRHDKKYKRGICILCFNANKETKETKLIRKEKREFLLSTPEGKYSEFKRSKKSSGVISNVSFEKFKSFLGQECTYCKKDRDKGYLGLINKDLGFIDENVIPICRCCNQSKRMVSEESFNLRVKRRYSKHDKEKIKENHAVKHIPQDIYSQRYSKLKSSAKSRNIILNLSLEEYIPICKLKCHYCNLDNTTQGLDRIDNNQGYVLNNVVSCCKTCNTMKNTMTYDEFINHIKIILRNI